MNSPQQRKSDAQVLEEFWEKVNEVRRESHWGDEEDSPLHEFGYKTQRGDELFTVTDFGNIAKWLLKLRQEDREAVREKVKGELRDLKHMECQKGLQEICDDCLHYLTQNQTLERILAFLNSEDKI